MICFDRFQREFQSNTIRLYKINNATNIKYYSAEVKTAKQGMYVFLSFGFIYQNSNYKIIIIHNQDTNVLLFIILDEHSKYVQFIKQYLLTIPTTMYYNH